MPKIVGGFIQRARPNKSEFSFRNKHSKEIFRGMDGTGVYKTRKSAEAYLERYDKNDDFEIVEFRLTEIQNDHF